MSEKVKFMIARFVFIILLIFPLLYLILSRLQNPNDFIRADAPQMNAIPPVASKTLVSAKKNALDNPSFHTYLELGLRYYEEKQFEESVMATQKALEYNPESHLAYNNLCAAYNELKLWDRAIECCNKALKLSPEFQLAKNNLNWAVMEKEKLKVSDSK